MYSCARGVLSNRCQEYSEISKRPSQVSKRSPTNYARREKKEVAKEEEEEEMKGALQSFYASRNTSEKFEPLRHTHTHTHTHRDPESEGRNKRAPEVQCVSVFKPCDDSPLL